MHKQKFKRIMNKLLTWNCLQKMKEEGRSNKKTTKLKERTKDEHLSMYRKHILYIIRKLLWRRVLTFHFSCHIFGSVVFITNASSFANNFHQSLFDTFKMMNVWTTPKIYCKHIIIKLNVRTKSSIWIFSPN